MEDLGLGRGHTSEGAAPRPFSLQDWGGRGQRLGRKVRAVAQLGPWTLACWGHATFPL